MAATYVVTGANRGLGLEFARQLGERGDEVIATARRPDEAEELRGLEVDVFELDVAEPGSIAGFAQAISGRSVDVLINNAGIGVDSTAFEEVEPGDLLRFFEGNTVGPLRVSKALMPHLREADTRKVVNMTSRMGSIADNGSGKAYEYRASKAALNMVTRSMAIDLEDDGFVCVVLHPGWVQTDMGGARAPTPPEESIAGMLEVIEGLDAADSGEFYDYTGARVPW